MGDSCWPRDAQACLVRSGFGGLVARKEVERRALHANSRSFSFGSDQSRAKRRRTRLERQTDRTGARTSSAVSEHSLAGCADAGWSRGFDGGSIRSSSCLGPAFFSTCFFCARCSTRGTHWPDASMLGGFSRRRQKNTTEMQQLQATQQRQRGQKVQQQRRSRCFGRILMLLCAGGFRVGTLRVR